MQSKFDLNFIVIAGPNGSGKSTTSEELLKPHNIIAFDWDDRFQQRWNRFDFDPILAEGIRESVNQDFHDHINSAFNSGQSVAYETNFHSHFNLELATKAREFGYRTVLHFLSLETPELATFRVAERVKNGGHDVSKSTIYERFEAGLKILDNEAIRHYDDLAVYDSSEEFNLQITITNEEVTHLSDNLNKSIFKHLPKISSLIN